LWTTITGGAVWTGRLVNRKKDGTLYEEEAAITPIRDHAGRIVSYVAVKRDVTREVRLKKQLRQAQKMEAIGTLAGGIAHDFNNILAAIIGYTELARMDLVENAPLMDNINKVLVASYRARDLVAQILAFSRQSEQELKPVSISSIVKEVLKLLRASLPATIDIRQRVLLEPATILADATQIHQVLMNICANAGHAMRSTGGVLDVYLGAPRGEFEPPLSLQHLAGEDYLCLAIRDTGHGMPSEILDRIFDPYFTTKKKEEGTGLGLAVVHGIVTSHNGHLTVESKPGEGTTFKIYFPLVPVKVFDRKKSLGVKLPGGSERVFLIDDEIDIVQVNRQMLERLGYQVAAYVDSRTALADFDAAPEKVDLLITDLTMPGLTGDQVVRAVHARRPELPIIMCTGFSEMITQEKAQAVGVRKLMMKPLSVGALARTIREVLD
jgi:signal transduction histidine kinase